MSQNWLGGWTGGLTDCTAPVMLSYCAIASDGLAGQVGVRGGVEGIGSMPRVWFPFFYLLWLREAGWADLLGVDMSVSVTGPMLPALATWGGRSLPCILGAAIAVCICLGAQH